MGNIFTIDNDIREPAQLALDDFITEFGKWCRLYYPPKMVPTSVSDPIGNKPPHYWTSGAHISNPFSGFADGDASKAQEVSEPIQLLCQFDPKRFWKPIPNLDVRIAHSVIQTKGFLVDVPKIKMAEYMVFQSDIENLLQKKYKLIDEPADLSNIIKGRYFVCSWQQI